jgi:hypothetical protein
VELRSLEIIFRDVLLVQFIFIFSLWLYRTLFGPWALLQFLNPIHSRKDSLEGETARRKAPT